MHRQDIINQMIALSKKKYDLLIKLKGLSEKQNEAFGKNASILLRKY